MTGLEETFYIMAIVFMSLTFLMIIAILSAVLVIRSKINKIHDQIEDRLNTITSIAEKGGELSAMVSTQAFKQAQKAFKKARK
jgi:cell division protein FtsL